MKELVLRDEPGFRLRVVMDNSLDPGQSKNVQFFQEVKNTDGSVRHTSSHQFFMTREELTPWDNFLETPQRYQMLHSYAKSQQKPPQKYSQVTKMKKYSFRRWIRNWINEDETEMLSAIASSRVERSLDSDRAMNFRIFPAQGGRIVEINRYDSVKDRHYNSLYIVTNEQDLGKEIERIIVQEHLR